MNINATLIGQSIAFFVFVWFVMKYVWPPELAEKAAEKHIKEAKDQAAEIVTQAQKRASEIVEEAKDNAKEEAGRVKAAADAEIEQEINRAKEQLRQQIAGVAMAGAAKVLNREVDEKAHSDIVDDMIAQI